MKNFTLIALCAMLFSTGSLVAQPMTAPTAPTRAAADVISILSAAYTPLASNFTPVTPAVGINFFPNWDQGTTFSEFPVGGDPIKKYAALDYQGIEFGGSINASSMTTIHWDIWTDVVTNLKISLISNTPGMGERAVPKTTVVGWNSFDIPLTDYTSQSGFSVSSIFQFKFEENPSAYRAGTKTVYLDNIYFWKPANVPTITGFTVADKLTTDAPFALTAPTSNSTGAFTYSSSNPSVATISGSTVTIVGAGTSTITVNQAAAGAYAAGSTSAVLTVAAPGPPTAAPTPTKAAADVISLYSGAYSDVSGTNWFPNWGQSTVVTDVMIASNSTKKYTNLNYQGVLLSTVDFSTMQYLHLDYWSSSVTEFDVFLINAGSATVEQKITLSPTLSGWNSFDIPLAAYNNISLNGINEIKLEGRPSGGNVYLDNIYFHKTTATPMAAATTPANPASNVISMFSGAYSNKTINTWQTSWSANNSVLTDLQIGGNDVKKYVLKNFVGVEFTGANLINAAAATTMHIDVWTPLPIAAGGLKFKLVDVGANLDFGRTAAGDDTEGEISAPAIAGGAWVGLDIPFANFVAAGLANRAHLAQLIPSASTPIVVFMDNIYFYANTTLSVELTNLSAKSINKTTVLNWQTASEKYNQGFTVERSLNGADYAAIGQVKGFGTTNVAHSYAFTDATPANGVNYYRLRQADFNGKETLSKVVSVISGKNFLVLKNTLVQNLLDVTVGEETKESISIFNVSGQLVYSAKVQGNQLLDISALTSGLYIVRTETGDMSRFVKQ
jgi:Secretion system C-terminal sorting domain